MQGKSKAKTPAEYIASLDEPRRTEIRKLHVLILKSVPKLKQTMAFGMLGYGPYHYKYPSGREGDWFLIGLASQKNYISLHVCAANGSEYLAEKYAGELGKVSVGRSCIRFKKLEDVNLKAVVQVLKQAVKVGGMGAVRS